MLRSQPKCSPSSSASSFGPGRLGHPSCSKVSTTGPCYQLPTHPPTVLAGADASPAARPSASGVLGTASRPGSRRAATRAGLGAHGPQGMQELFLGLLERGERETILIGDKLFRSAWENRSGLPFLQGPDIGSAQAGFDIQLPQEFGDISLQFGLMSVRSAQEV